MTELAQRVEFWVAMMFAVLVKLRTSPQLTPLNAMLTTLAAISGALVFTEPVVEWLQFDSDKMRYATAAVVGLCCEHLARHIAVLTPKDLLELWRNRK